MPQKIIHHLLEPYVKWRLHILCMISLIFIVNFSANSMIYEMQLRHLSSVQHVKRTCIMLEYNLFKNVFNWPTFLWQTQIQTTEYSLNDTIGIKKKGVFLMIYSFTPFDINFQTILMAKVIFGKKSVKKELLSWNHSLQKYAWVTRP